MKQAFKLVTEMGPLVVFFLVNAKFGIFPATAAFMAATVVALSVSWLVMRKIPMMPLVTGVFVLVFGGLTLYLADETFIKLKPTIVNSIFGCILLGGLMMGHSALKYVLSDALPLDDEGWKKLTFRWGLFFFALAGLNEIVWRNFDTDTWVNFKVFGIMPITLVFALSQTGLMQRHMVSVGDE
ncbi:MAG: septation protein A [Hyphomicrobiales bacterium]